MFSLCGFICVHQCFKNSNHDKWLLMYSTIAQRYVGYCRVVGITTTVNTYIDIYCSLVSHTVVLSTAAASCNLKYICYWFHPSGVDQTTVGKWMPVESCAAGCSVRRQLMVLSPSWEPNAVAAILAAQLGRSDLAMHRSPWVQGSVALWSKVVTTFDAGSDWCS